MVLIKNFKIFYEFNFVIYLINVKLELILHCYYSSHLYIIALVILYETAG